MFLSRLVTEKQMLYVEHEMKAKAGKVKQGNYPSRMQRSGVVGYTE